MAEICPCYEPSVYQEAKTPLQIHMVLGQSVSMYLPSSRQYLVLVRGTLKKHRQTQAFLHPISRGQVLKKQNRLTQDPRWAWCPPPGRSTAELVACSTGGLRGAEECVTLQGKTILNNSSVLIEGGKKAMGYSTAAALNCSGGG